MFAHPPRTHASRVAVLSLLVATAAGTVSMDSTLYTGAGCSSTDIYPFGFGSCQAHNSVSFRVVAREMEECVAMPSMRIMYYSGSTDCTGTVTEAVLEQDRCASVGEISLKAYITGLSAVATCQVLNTFATVPEVSLTGQVFAGDTCSGACTGSCDAAALVPGLCFDRCCPDDAGGYSETYISCINENGANIVIMGKRSWTDDTCTTAADDGDFRYTDGRCEVRDSSSSVSYAVTSGVQAMCNAVYLMGEYNFEMPGTPLVSQEHFAAAVTYDGAQAAISGSRPIEIDFSEVIPVTMDSTVYAAADCSGTEYAFEMGVCQQVNSVWFKVLAREMEECLAMPSMRILYYGGSTGCTGNPTEVALESGTCTIVGDISFMASFTGLSTLDTCQVLRALATAPTLSLMRDTYLSLSCTGPCIFLCGNEMALRGPESVVRKDQSCSGCCPEDGSFSEIYMSCVNDGSNAVVLGMRNYTDASCTQAADFDEGSFTYADGRCRAGDNPVLPFSLRARISGGVQAICNAVYLMGRHNFSLDMSRFRLVSQQDFAAKVTYDGAPDAVERSQAIEVVFEAAPATAVTVAVLAVGLLATLF